MRVVRFGPIPMIFRTALFLYALCLASATASATEVTFRVVDQEDLPIAASRFELLSPISQTVEQDEPISLPPDTYLVRVEPGINGHSPAGDLYRDETVVIAGTSQTVEFLWNTTTLTWQVEDQNDNLVDGSAMWVGDSPYLEFLANGDSMVVPVTEDDNPSTAEEAGAWAAGYPVKIYPGIDGDTGPLFRYDNTGEVDETRTTASFEWKTANITFSVVDQSGSPVSATTLSAGGSHALSNGESLVLPVTHDDDPDIPEEVSNWATGYPVLIKPGVDGVSVGSKLYRDDHTGEVVATDTERTYTWRTVELSFAVQDQHGSPIPESAMTLTGVATLFNGDSITAPVTQDDDPLIPEEKGPWAAGYLVAVKPGVNGESVGSLLYRDDSTGEVEPTTTQAIFLWRTVELELSLDDQHGSPIPESAMTLTGVATLFNGDSITAPVTQDDDPSIPEELGPWAAGYPVRLTPGVDGISVGSLIYRDDNTGEVVPTTTHKNFLWRTVELEFAVENQSASPVDGTTMLLGGSSPVVATLSNGDSAVLPVTQDDDPSIPEELGPWAVGYPVMIRPGVDGVSVGSLMYRDDNTGEVVPTTTHKNFLWRTVELELALEDQSGTPIPGSTMFLSGVATLFNGDSITAPVTQDDDPSIPEELGPWAVGYPLAIRPGVDGISVGSLMYRDDNTGEVVPTTTHKNFLWRTVELELALEDQSGTPIPGSTMFLSGVATLSNGDSITAPVTQDDDPSIPEELGPWADGYPLAIRPGVDGISVGSLIYRDDNTGEVVPTTTQATFQWKITELTFGVKDQEGAPIPATVMHLGGSPTVATLSNGDNAVVPVTEDDDPSVPEELGPWSTGYPVTVVPGINERPQSSWLTRYDSTGEVTVDDDDVAFIWEVASGTFFVVDGFADPLPDALFSSGLGGFQSGSYSGLPVNDASIYPTLLGRYATGYDDFYVELLPGDDSLGPVEFVVSSNRTLIPSMFDIDGVDFGFSFLFGADVTPGNNAVDVSPSVIIASRFGDPVNPATVTTSSFRLLQGESAVPGFVAVAPDGRAATFTPAAALEGDTIYNIELTSDILNAGSTDNLIPRASFFRTRQTTEPLEGRSDAVSGGAAGALNGTSVFGAGDLNDDGQADFMSGAPGSSRSAAEAGAALVYLGSEIQEERESPDIAFVGAAAHDRAGVSVAGDFDFNLDGIPDLLIGAEQVDRTDPFNPVAVGSGRVYLIYFDPDDPRYIKPDPETPAEVSLSLVGQPGGIPGVVFFGEALGDQAGLSIAAQTSPGTPDIAIGAPGRDPEDPENPGVPRADAGSVYVFYNASSLAGSIDLGQIGAGLEDQVSLTLYQGASPGDNLGFSVAFPGDVGGDTHDDLAMGAPGFDSDPVGRSTTEAGAVYVVNLDASDEDDIIEVDDITPTAQGTVIVGTQIGEQMGWDVFGGGDNQGDGELDLLMSAPFYDSAGGQDVGRVIHTAGRLVFGTVISADDVGAIATLDPTATVPGTIWIGTEAGATLGYSVAGVGDVTGNGRADLVLGAPLSDAGGTLPDAGSLYFIEGVDPANATLGNVEVDQIGTTIPGGVLLGVEAGEQVGSSTSGSGDVNGDRGPDFLAGAPLNSAEGEAAGRVYVILESVPGVCGPDGCTVVELSSGTQLEVPPGALMGIHLLSVTGNPDPEDLTAMPPEAQGLLAVGAYGPRGLMLEVASTIDLPVLGTYEGQVTPGEEFELHVLDADSWIPTGIAATAVANPYYPGLTVLNGEVDELDLYVAFIADQDGDGLRDSVDPDLDGDGFDNGEDNCPDMANAGQEDGDEDGVGDVCDNCPGTSNSDQQDTDGDGEGNVCDACPEEYINDADGDGPCCPEDNCCVIYNPSQSDRDENGVGDACEPIPILIVSSDPSDNRDYVTIGEAVAAAESTHTTIEILPGLGPYTENVVLDRGMTLDLVGASGGSRPILAGNPATPTIDVVSAAAIAVPSIEHLVINGGDGINAQISTRVSDCEFASITGTAIDLGTGSHLLKDVSVVSAGATGLDLAGGATLLAERVIFQGLPTTAIQVSGTAEIRSSLLAQNSVGILVSSSATLELTHSTIAGNSLAGVDNTAGGSVTVDASIAWGNATDLIGVSCATVSRSDVGTPDCSGSNGNVSVDPLFSTGYHLSAASPLLEFDDPATFDGIPCLDLAAGPRLRDYDSDGLAQLDLGAYEEPGTSSSLEVLDLVWNSSSTLNWSAVATAVEYHVYRGGMATLDYSEFGQCQDLLDPDRTDTTLVDDSVPLAGGGYFYMITAEDVTPIEGSPGTGSCAERSLFDSCSGSP